LILTADSSSLLTWSPTPIIATFISSDFAGAAGVYAPAATIGEKINPAPTTALECINCLLFIPPTMSNFFIGPRFTPKIVKKHSY